MKKLCLGIFSMSLIMVTSTIFATDKEPPTNLKTAPSTHDVAKTPQANTKASPQYASRDDEEETQEASEIQSCEGIPSDITVEPRVQKFLGCKIVQILAQPERVASFKMEPHKNPNLPERNRLGEYPIAENGQGRDLNDTEIKDLQNLFFAKTSYYFGIEKRCRFQPDMGLHFVKGDESVEVLLSFPCNLWLFVYQAEDKLEDFDPVQEKLATLRDSLFSQ